MPLQTVEARFFSEGLHVLGQPPSSGQLQQYLEAYFDGAIPPDALQAVSEHDGASLDQIRARLERSLDKVQTGQTKAANSNKTASEQGSIGCERNRAAACVCVCVYIQVYSVRSPFPKP